MLKILTHKVLTEYGIGCIIKASIEQGKRVNADGLGNSQNKNARQEQNRIKENETAKTPKCLMPSAACFPLFQKRRAVKLLKTGKGNAMVFQERTLYTVLNLVNEEDKMPLINAERAIEKILAKYSLNALRPAYIPSVFFVVANRGPVWYYRQAESMSVFREYLNQ